MKSSWVYLYRGYDTFTDAISGCLPATACKLLTTQHKHNKETETMRCAACIKIDSFLYTFCEILLLFGHSLERWGRVDDVPFSEKLGGVCSVPLLVPKFVGVGDGEGEAQLQYSAHTHCKMGTFPS